MRRVLTDREVDEIRRLRATGAGYSALAARFEVSWWTICSVCLQRRRVSEATSKHAPKKKPPEGG